MLESYKELIAAKAEIKMLKKQLEEAKKATPEWISVKDRLPELIPCTVGTAYSEAVLVWTSGKKAMAAVWNGTDFLRATSFWEAWGEEITHWMPLPEPPKEVKPDAQNNDPG